MDSTDCPTCGETFDTTRAMKYHHNVTHGESIAGVKITCDNCGETKRRNPAKIEGKDNVYCSRECQYNDRIEIPKGTLYEYYWGEQLSAYEIAEKENTSEQVVRRRMREYGIPVSSCGSRTAWVFEMRGREWLRNEYVSKAKSIYQIARENNVYHEYVRRKLHELDIPLRNEWWINRDNYTEPTRDAYDYGPKWDEIKSIAQTRDDNRCQDCGSTKNLHVHHIIPFRTFDSREEANKLDNLLTLCATCHKKWESIPLRPSPA